MRVLFLLIVALVCCSKDAVAQLRLPALLSDGAVLQRDKSLQIWGWASPEERISLIFEHLHLTATADSQGRWQIQLPAQQAGGPYTFKFVGQSQQIQLNDLYFGDVWLASGQSNMELPVRRVLEKYPQMANRKNFPLIRQFLVPRAYDFQHPHDDYPQVAWRTASVEHIQDFSALAYFFAEALTKAVNVPIGIINSSYGGSPVQSWMSEQALANFPDEMATAKYFRNQANIDALEADNQQKHQQWHQLADHQDLGLLSDPAWYSATLQDKDWPSLHMPGFWQEQGESFSHGVLWLRKNLYLTQQQAKQTAILRLGSITDADQTYINGQLIGNTTYQYPPRIYQVPAGLLKEGENTLTIRVLSHRGQGGLVPDKPYELRLVDERIDLSGDWHYQIGTDMPPLANAEFIAWKPLGLFNAMLAPATRFAIKGVIWYQGESNTGAPQHYADMFMALIQDWRLKWQQPALPFVFVQLSALNPYQHEPVQSNWAALRQQQLQSLALDNTAMAVSFDLGEWNDIHPLEKKRLAQRMALAARHLTYDEVDLVYSGPLFSHLIRKKNSLLLAFNHMGTGLTAKGQTLTGFTLAGSDGRFVNAKARIDGRYVRLWSDEVSDPVAVRYGWQDNPQDANLYNLEGLPASPFEATLMPNN
ncbi:sialate O-acetylesterase [Bowmanella denitrificans]|uniref:sialate O-acetylesterase n=1 Tax=Bowmanella denitrificans TaxID=366582 RepID=UPI000C9B29CA|nr:sialate O-acetylesterase [Bowmanella denitrificans]